MHWVALSLFDFSQSWSLQMKLLIDTVVLLYQLTAEHVNDRGTILSGPTYRGTKPSVDIGRD